MIQGSTQWAHQHDLVYNFTLIFLRGWMISKFFWKLWGCGPCWPPCLAIICAISSQWKVFPQADKGKNLEDKSKPSELQKKKFGFHQALEGAVQLGDHKVGFIKVGDATFCCMFFVLKFCKDQYSGELSALFFYFLKLVPYVFVSSLKWLKVFQVSFVFLFIYFF